MPNRRRSYLSCAPFFKRADQRLRGRRLPQIEKGERGLGPVLSPFVVSVHVIGLKDFQERFDGFAHDARFKGIFHAVFLDQGAEWIFASHLAKFQITLPSQGVILPVQIEELESHDLGQGVIDVIERDFEDMGLKQPAVARL